MWIERIGSAYRRVSRRQMPVCEARRIACSNQLSAQTVPEVVCSINGQGNALKTGISVNVRSILAGYVRPAQRLSDDKDDNVI